jgi:hypothetical protein
MPAKQFVKNRIAPECAAGAGIRNDLLTIAAGLCSI